MDTRSSSWVLDRPVIGGSITLQEGITSIGRSGACAIVVTSDYVSRVHAQFQVQPGSDEIEIEDLGSTNGVFVNGVVYNNVVVKLHVGDRIGIGVSVDDDQITPDGKFPMYELRRISVVNANTTDLTISEKALHLDVIKPPTHPSGLRDEDSDDCIILSSSEDECDDDVDDFVAPQMVLELDNCFRSQERQPSQTPPPRARIKIEREVEENIRSIFGNISQDLINSAKNSINAPQQNLNNGSLCNSSHESGIANRLQTGVQSTVDNATTIPGGTTMVEAGTTAATTSTTKPATTGATISMKNVTTEATTASTSSSTRIATTPITTASTSSSTRIATTPVTTASATLVKRVAIATATTAPTTSATRVVTTAATPASAPSVTKLATTPATSVTRVGTTTTTTSSAKSVTRVATTAATTSSTTLAKRVAITTATTAPTTSAARVAATTSSAKSVTAATTSSTTSALVAITTTGSATSKTKVAADQTSTKTNLMTTTTSTPIDDAAPKNDNNIVAAPSPKNDFVDENEDEELYFTQQLFDDLKEELPNSDNEMPGDYEVDDEGSLILPPIKQEKFSQSFIDLVADDDDDEYDENLETDVTNWSFKLFSKNTSNSFNLSQVYEDDIDSLPAREKVDKNSVEPEGKSKDIESNHSCKSNTDSVVAETNEKREGPLHESSVPRVWKRSISKNRFLNSSSSSEDEFQGDKAKQNQEAKRVPSPEDKVNAPQTRDEIPKKKPRLNSASEKNNKSKSHFVNSKKILESTSPSASPKDSPVIDPFDALKISEKTSKKDSTIQRQSSDDSSNSTKAARHPSFSDHQPTLEPDKDVFEIDKAQEPEQTTHKAVIRGPPEIIAPPQLPINKGKLRGVSAVLQRSTETIKVIEFQKDLKRKWLQKPSVLKRQEKEKLKAIKEERKQKLKELADKQLTEPSNKKSKTINNDRKNSKELVVKHTKCTAVSRGAFLTEGITKKPYKIPKIKTNPLSDTTGLTTSSILTNNGNTTARSFQDELSKVDSVTQNSHKPPTSIVCRDRQKSSDVSTARERQRSSDAPTARERQRSSDAPATRERQKSSDVPMAHERRKSLDAQTEQKERAPPRRITNKLTFDAMEKYLKETGDARQKLQKMAVVEKPIVVKPKPKKKVRFNDTPQIFYIEPLSSTRPVNKKESSSFDERRLIIRRRFPLVDHTDELLTKVLSWSQIYLQDKMQGFNVDGLGEMIYPMLNQFGSIEAYKSIVFPLLKEEFLSHLDNSMDRFKSKFKIRVDYIAPYKDRELLMAKSSSSISRSDLAMTDLVLIEVVMSDTETRSFFGYVGNMRKTNTSVSITVEVLPNVFPKENFKKAKAITIRRIIEALRVYFGSFNAVHQLDKTPLMEMILNPEKIVNVSSNWHNQIAYKGWDPLNEQQKEILLKTYAKSIAGYNPNISLIKGPPGTGKSRLIANLALQYLYGDEVRLLDKKILICAHSNMAVDVISHQLYQIQKNLSPKYNVIRFGKIEKIAKNVQDITLSRLIEREHQARMQGASQSPDQISLGSSLNREIITLEARIAELQRQNLLDVRKDELVEMKKDLALKKSIQNQRPTAEDEKLLFRTFLGNANIICTTLTSCVKLGNYVDYFDVCIIDEATQCIEPWTIMPLRFGVTSLVMVGDVQQLPATVLSQKAKAYGLGNSLFTRIQKCLENKDNDASSPIVSLSVQYRMHPEICQWPNLYFYQNQLQSAPNTSEFKSLIKPFSILNLEYRQNNDCHRGQISNSLEAEFVAKLAKVLDGHIPNKFFSYGIITPYATHREKLESMIRNNGVTNVLVNTVDSYQGIEKDVIIISNARTQGVGFLANYQRLNVALTRPKKCLILCGNFKNLESVPSWANLLQNAKERGLYHNISATDALDVEKNVIEKIKIRRP